jgi:AraC-like DNA-binding protein
MAESTSTTSLPSPSEDGGSGPEAAGLAHPLRHRLLSSTSPEQSARILGNVLPLRDLEALTEPGGWWHHDGHFPLPAFPIAAWLGSPFLMDIDPHPHHWLLLHHDGHADLAQNAHGLRLSPGDGVFLPGQSFRLTTEQCSATALPIDPKHLLQEANAMAPPGWFAPPHALPLRQPRSLASSGDGHSRALLGAIHQLMPSMVQLDALQLPLLQALMPTQTLLRLLAALVFPDLRDGQGTPLGPSTGAGTGQRSEHPLDPLLTFILGNLQEPLSLSTLERVSNYSRRTLQYAFHDHCGCSPMQWIRQQRLARAHQRLLHPEPGDTVTAISAACGYRSLSRFNVDYKRAFGAKPSTVLRQGTLPIQGPSTHGVGGTLS